MIIETIQAIIKMDHGELECKHIENDSFKIELWCKFGILEAKCKHLDEGITQVCKMYQLLETSNVTIDKVPF